MRRRVRMRVRMRVCKRQQQQSNHPMSKKSSVKKESSILTREEAVEAREAFDLFDPTRSASVAVSDLPAALQALGIDTNLADIKKLLSSEKNDNQIESVSFDLFLTIVSNFRVSNSANSELALAFKLLDKSGDGFITLEDLRKVVRELDEKFTDQDLREMILEADQSKSGRVSLQDFRAIMQETTAKSK